jgi:2-oxoisovalerate dehydrogenase E1 component beta subunit
MVHTASDAADRLAAEDGLEVEVLDLRTILPWDREAVLESVRRTSRILVLHEDTRTAGFGAEIAATVADEAFSDLDAPVRRLAAPDTPVPFSPPLERRFLPGVDDVVAELRELVQW